MSFANAGGFLPPSLPSPAPSQASTLTQSTLLPQPRAQPLKPGSSKESIFINHVDARLLTIQRRHAKKHSSAWQETEAKGYELFEEVARDVSALMDVVWVSGTPHLQISYLLTLALLINDCIPSYPFRLRPTLDILRKFDQAFASLLTGSDIETGAALPGLGFGQKAVSQTEKVRLKAVAQKARFLVFQARDARDADDQDEGVDEESATNEVTETETEDEVFEEVAARHDAGEIWQSLDTAQREELAIGKVYEQTISLVGDTMTDPDVMTTDFDMPGMCG